MARILMAWELGANLGHIEKLMVIARSLRARGHEPVFVLRDLSRAFPRVAAEGFRMGQAPLWLPRLNVPPRQGNFANVLTAAGWLDAPGLAGLITAWQTWFNVLDPDVLLANFAPTALLAARASGLRTWACGSGFELPPELDGSFAPFFPEQAGEQQACRGYDASLLPTVNAALGLLGQSPLQRLPEVFAGTRKALLTLPELAHYGDIGRDAQDTHWVGPIFAADSGVPAVWPGSAPDDNDRRAFVYLEPGYPDFEALFNALKLCGVRTLAHAKGLAPQAAQRLSGPLLRFEAAPVRMGEAVAGADLVVCHGGQGTLAAALLAGKPVLVLPTQLEQAMAARRVVAGGLGLAVDLGAKGQRHAPLVRRLLEDPAFAAATRGVAARHAGLSPQATGERVADLVLQGL